MVISLAAKGLTTGEVQAHLAEAYGAEVSRQTISAITDKVLEGMAEWQSRPLDAVYPVVFIEEEPANRSGSVGRAGRAGQRPSCRPRRRLRGGLSEPLRSRLLAVPGGRTRRTGPVLGPWVPVGLSPRSRRTLVVR